MLITALAIVAPGSAAPQAVVDVGAGENIQRQIDRFPAGTTFRLAIGVHRLENPLLPRPGNTFVGTTGTVISGARVLRRFTRSGDYWVLGGQTQQGPAQGECSRESPRCVHPEELFIDDVVVRHVQSLAEVRPGRWYFDYAADRIYLGDNPEGRVVETAVVASAFTGVAPNVTIAMLRIEKFANPAQAGAIDATRATGWVARSNEVRFNHGIGIRIGHAMIVTDNDVHHNGQLGIGGIGNDVLVEGNTIANNNTSGFDHSWEAGGTKFVKTNRLVIRRNHVHHNVGPGIWLDADNIGYTIEHNVTEGNGGAGAAAPGIMIEISYGGVIRHNTVRRNGLGFFPWAWGAGILIAASGGTGLDVHDNVVEDNGGGIALVQQARGSGAYGPYVVQNVWVHDNALRFGVGISGAVQDTGDRNIFTTRNNRFERNVYDIRGNPAPFAWDDGPRTDRYWRDTAGQDSSGTFLR